MTSVAHMPPIGKNEEAKPAFHYTNPENFFAPHPDVTADDACDVLDALLSRAHGVIVTLMSDCTDLKRGFSLSPEIISNCLWSVQGMIEQAQAAQSVIAKGVA